MMQLRFALLDCDVPPFLRPTVVDSGMVVLAEPDIGRIAADPLLLLVSTNLPGLLVTHPVDVAHEMVAASKLSGR